jgi:putative SOS response-associated peptidase YedK
LLVVTDGFYEWRNDGSKKQPFFIHRPDDRPFAFACLWEHWRRGELVIESCTTITTEQTS